MEFGQRRVDIIRFSGYAALFCGALLALQMMTYRIVGANIYTETDWPTTLWRTVDHRSLFTLSGGLGALAAGCTIPLMAGFYFTLEERDRPFCVIAFGFLMLYAILSVDAFAHFGNLVGTAMDYANQAAPPSTVVEVADAAVSDQFEILQFAAFVSFGIGLIMLSWLMLRSSYYQKWLSAFTLVVGISSFSFTLIPIVFTTTRLVWMFFFSVTWLREVEPEQETEPIVTS